MIMAAARDDGKRGLALEANPAQLVETTIIRGIAAGILIVSLPEEYVSVRCNDLMDL
jgi:hypothetical protein